MKKSSKVPLRKKKLAPKITKQDLKHLAGNTENPRNSKDPSPVLENFNDIISSIDKDSSSTDRKEDSESSSNKIKLLTQVIEEQEKKINSLEQICLNKNPNFLIIKTKPKAVEEVSFSPTEVRNLKITNPDIVVKSPFSQEEISRNKFKDLEIFKLRKHLSSDSEKLEELKKKNLKLRENLKYFKERYQMIENFEVVIENMKLSHNQKILTINQDIKNKSKETKEKSQCINEMRELLKESEMNRYSSNENNIFIESYMKKFREKIKVLEMEKECILLKIRDVRKSIKDTDEEIKVLNTDIKGLEKEIKYFKAKNKIVKYQIKAGNMILKSNTQRYEDEKANFQRQLERLNTQIAELSSESNDNSSTEMRSPNNELIKLLNELNHLKSLKEDAKKELEVLRKTEISLNKHLKTKDLIISSFEELIRLKQQKINPKNFEAATENTKEKCSLSDYKNIIKSWKKRFDKLKKNISCIKCDKLKKNDFFLLVNCGHLICSQCKTENEQSCVKCKSPIKDYLKSLSLHVLITSLKTELDFLRKSENLN